GEDVDGNFDPVASQVFRLYQAALDREPDANGLRNWVDRLSSDLMSLQQAADGFVNSREFQGRYGNTTDAEFVTLLYGNVLDRNPDANGLANWTEQLSSGDITRPEVVLRFSESAEFRASTVTDVLGYSRAAFQADWADDIFRLYHATLDRNPDMNGLEKWAATLADGQSILSVTSGFVNSAEFQNRYGATTNSEFVTLLYHNVLDRHPDANGLANWTERLDSDKATRADIVNSFAHSAEFRTKSADPFEAWMRGQGGDRLEGGAGDNILFGGIGADTFVFNIADGGTQTVVDLEAWDTVEIENSGYADEDALIEGLTQFGSDVLLDDNGTTILFENINRSQIDSDTFLFL
ncbi:MAG: DUF4214 domain-containing protein, partial [Sulfitobacter sp.]